MGEENEINMKIELCKDKDSDELVIIAHFDPNAPNFFRNDDNYSWMPTPKEMNLINEAYNLIENNKIKKSYEKTNYASSKNEEIPKTPLNNEGKRTFNTPPLEKTGEATFNEETNYGPGNNYQDNMTNRPHNPIIQKSYVDI